MLVYFHVKISDEIRGLMFFKIEVYGEFTFANTYALQFNYNCVI